MKLAGSPTFHHPSQSEALAPQSHDPHDSTHRVS